MIDRYALRMDTLSNQIRIVDKAHPGQKSVFRDWWHGPGEMNYVIHHARLVCAHLNNLNDQALLPY